MNMVTLGKPQAVPYDIQAEQEKLLQRREIAKLLEMQAFAKSSPTSDAGRLQMPNWGDAISKVVNAYVGGELQNETAAKASELALEKQRRTQQGMSDLFKGFYGGPQEAAGPPQAGQEGQPLMMNVKGDPMRAVSTALGNSDPTVQAQAKAMWEDYQKRNAPPTAKEWMEYGSKYGTDALKNYQQSIEGGQLDPSTLTGRPDVKLHEGIGVTTQDGAITGTQPVNKWQQPYVDPKTGVPIVRSEVTGETKGLSGGNVTPPAQKGAASFWEKSMTDRVKAMSETKAKLETQVQAIPQTMAAFDLAGRANLGGPWADWITMAQKVGQATGFKVDEASAIPASEQLNAYMSKGLLREIGGLGNQISDKDRDFLVKSEGIGGSTDERTVKALSALKIAGTLNMIAQHDRDIGSVQEALKGPDADPRDAQAVEMYRVPMKLNLTPDQEKALGLYQDPATGLWSTHLTDAPPLVRKDQESRTGVKAEPVDVDPAVKNYLEQRRKARGG